MSFLQNYRPQYDSKSGYDFKSGGAYMGGQATAVRL